MSDFLQTQLPGAILTAVQAASSSSNSTGSAAGALGNGTLTPGLDIDKVWSLVGGQYPLTGLGPLAVLLSFLALIVIGILLIATWQLARATLSLHTRHVFQYGADQNKTRVLRLPANGFILLCLLVSAVCEVVQLLQWEAKGRVFVFVGSYQTIDACGFVALWLAGVSLVLSGVRSVPLVREDTGPGNAEVPTSYGRPILHPLAVDALLLLLPALACIAPAGMTLINTVSAYETLNTLIDTTTASNNGTITISAGLSAVTQQVRIQLYSRSAAIFVLFLVLVSLECKAYSRLGKLAAFVEQSVSQAQIEAEEEEAEKYTELPAAPALAQALSMPGSLKRGYSRSSSYAGSLQSRHSGQSGRSRLSTTHPALLHPNHLHMLPELDMQLPSPSLLRDEDLAPVYPVNDFPRENLDHPTMYRERADTMVSEFGVLHGSRPISRASSYRLSASYEKAQYAERGGHPAASCYEDLSKDWSRTAARGELMLPEMVRQRTNASSISHRSSRSGRSSCSSCSCTSSQRSLKRLHLGSRQRSYEGPSSADLLSQRRHRLFDVGLLASLLLLLTLVNLAEAGLLEIILDSRLVHAGTEISRMALQTLPVLIGLLAAACRGSAVVYGWAGQTDSARDRRSRGIEWEWCEKA